MTPMKRFWSLLRPDKKQISQIYLYAIFSGLVSLSLPLGIQTIINFIQMGSVSATWFLLVLFVLVGILVTGILQILQLRIVENIQQKIFVRSAFEFAYRIPKIKLIEQDKIHLEEIVNRFFDTLTIQKGMPKMLIDFTQAVFLVFFSLLLLAVYSPYFIALGVLLYFMLWVIFKLTAQKGLTTSLKESKYKYAVAFWLEEIAHSKKTFKTSEQNGLHIQKTNQIVDSYLYARQNHFGVLLSQYKYFIGFKVILAAGLLILGSILVFNGQMNIGQFVAAEIVILLVISSIEKIINILETVYDVLTGLDKIGYVTDLKLDENQGNFVPVATQGMSISMKDIAFRFDKKNPYIFKDFSADISSGEKVLITGKKGSGKTILLHLIAGFYDLNQGEILLDGVMVNHHEKNHFYQSIGINFSVNQLFEGTILENITLGRPLDERRIFEVIENLGLEEYLMRLEKGLESKILPEGKELPSGVIQKLHLARALVHNPRLLLLEEPLQSIEVEHQPKIIDYILKEDPKRTVIIIGNTSSWENKVDKTINLNDHA